MSREDVHKFASLTIPERPEIVCCVVKEIQIDEQLRDDRFSPFSEAAQLRTNCKLIAKLDAIQ